VWLHWDPQTVKARGVKAMLNLSMDFLMLLPGGHRIVLEVDGRHHYATGRLADPSVYAATMRGDRDLRLARYDVFRFGAADLDEEQPAREMLRAFSRTCSAPTIWREAALRSENRRYLSIKTWLDRENSDTSRCSWRPSASLVAGGARGSGR
jgi:hypothetical protein